MVVTVFEKLLHCLFRFSRRQLLQEFLIGVQNICLKNLDIAFQEAVLLRKVEVVHVRQLPILHLVIEILRAFGGRHAKGSGLLGRLC